MQLIGVFDTCALTPDYSC